jgi:hypothetical protein
MQWSNVIDALCHAMALVTDRQHDDIDVLYGMATDFGHPIQCALDSPSVFLHPAHIEWHGEKGWLPR